MFSARVPGLRSNRIARALARARAGGLPLDDLTVSNPTAIGIPYPHGLLEPLARPEALRYEPAPFGLPCAREAVATHLRAAGVQVPMDRVILTASTSEAYSLLFKLLCDPADRVLTPQPSYPLFDHLTRLDAVVASPYALEYHGRWELNLASLREALDRDARVRAVLLVSPNNPTGSFVRQDELDAVSDLAAERGLALICDEVFHSYALPAYDSVPPGRLVMRSDVLTFTLGGLSKMAGLPQLKLGWILVGGPERLVTRALSRLELICDSYLSVATPVQLAVDTLLEQTKVVVADIEHRIRTNHACLEQVVRKFPATQLLRVEAGWYAVIQVPAVRSEEAMVLDLIEQERIYVHPGYFFDFPREAFLIVSLLPEPIRFGSVLARMLARVGTSPS